MAVISATLVPKISLIIPGWNESKNVLTCIDSLRKQIYPNFNVIMVLGGQDPISIERVKQLNWDKLIILDQLEPNKMRAYNTALDCPEIGNIILFSDMDCTFPKDFIQRYHEAMCDHNKNIVTGRVCPDQKGESIIDNYHRCLEAKIASKKPTMIQSIMGANFGVRKDFLWNQLGRFDESIGIGTDKAITRRMQEIGEPIYFDPDIIVYTQFFSAGIIKYISQQARWIRIRVLRNKNHNRKSFRLSIMALLIAWLQSIILPIALIFSAPVWQTHWDTGWYLLGIIWVILLIHAWRQRYNILRRAKGNPLKDAGAALVIMLLHYCIRIIASIQLVLNKYRLQW